MPASPPPATGSGEIVREILTVLVENAFVHGAGVVTVSVREMSSGWVTIEVGDEGPGIPAGVDDAFSRREGGGHGIGLALARSLAEAEGARLLLRHEGPSPVFAPYLPQPTPASREEEREEPVP